MDEPVVLESGEIQGLQGGSDLLRLRPGLLAVHMAAAGEEGEGLDPQGQGLGGFGVLGVEIHLAAHEQGFEESSQESPRRFIGRGGEVVDPEALAFGHGAGERGQVLLAHALLALEQDDALHGDGGAEAQHEGLEVGEFLGAATEGAGQGLGEVPRMVPGQVLR